MSSRQARKEQKLVREQKQAAVSRAVRSQAEYAAELRHQIGFLRSSAAAYDAGNEAEAKRLATTVRVLVHDTKFSTSLLTQLGVKTLIRFLDTAGPVDPRNMMTTSGLTLLRMSVDEGRRTTAQYIPKLDDAREINWVDFATWWEMPVARMPVHGVTLSRSTYVLSVADKEGGAHFDATSDPAYQLLSKENGLGWTVGQRFADTGQEVNFGPPQGNPAFAAIRQVAFEMMATVERELRQLLEGGTAPA